MADATKRKNWLMPGLILAFLLGCWLTFNSYFGAYTPPTLPTPNGYDDLLKAAQMLAPRTGFYDEMDEAELAVVVAQNAPALELAREALQKQCVVALNWSADRAWLDTVHVPNCESMRELARAFAAGALQSRNTNRADEAVGCGLNGIELAQACSRGGILIDRMTARAVHHRAMYSLRDQIDRLTRDDCLRLIKKVQNSPLQLESPELVLEREAALFRQITGAIQTFMMRGVIQKQRQETLDQMELSDRQHAVMALLLQTHLALRAYKIDNSQLPTSLEALVPLYLPRVPGDLFSSNSLIYRPTAERYLLFSVGANGLDDGGREGTDGSDGDILLDAIE